LFSPGVDVAEHVIHYSRSTGGRGTITCRWTVSVFWVDSWPTVSLIAWIDTPLLDMIDIAARRPSWACQRPMPPLGGASF
jgi:hypothetical protein